jgi:mono/diheme cytochrome c family protein
MRISRTGGIALALALTLAPGCGEGDTGEPGGELEEDELRAAALDPALAAHLPPGATFEEAQQGRELFTVCTTCHGLDGEGTPLAPSLRDPEWLHVEPDVGQIAALIRDGVDPPREYPVPMPPHGGGAFDDEQLRALAVYVMLLSREGATP